MSMPVIAEMFPEVVAVARDEVPEDTSSSFTVTRLDTGMTFTTECPSYSRNRSEELRQACIRRIKTQTG